MKKKMGYILSIFLAACFFAGCGGEFAGLSRERAASGGAISGGAVSGGAVSGGAVSEGAVSGGAVKKIPVEKGRKKDRNSWFYSENNFYYVREVRGSGDRAVDWVIIERDLSEGTEREIRRKDLSALCYVDDDWVYYVAWEEGVDSKEDQEPASLYRAPIEKNRMNIRKEECLLTDKNGISELDSIYCDGRYLLYITADGDGTYKKYDLKKKKYVGNLDKESNFNSEILSVVDGYVYLRMGEEEEEAFYWEKLEEAKVTKIIDEMVWGMAHIAIGKDVYYAEEYAMPFTIMKYNVENGSREEAVSEKQLDKLFEQNKLLPGTDRTYEEYDLIGMFVSGNRLYMQFQTHWDDEKGVTFDKIILVYLEPEKGGELHYDKVLTEYLAYDKPQEEWFDGTFLNKTYCSRGRCVEMTDERCYMEVHNPESDKNTLACYDFQSREFMYLTEADLDWHLPYFTAPFRNFERLLGGEEPLEGREYDWPYEDYE